jgi:hypothetical protein
VCLRKLSTSVLSLLYELMLIHPFYYIRGATHVILSISTLKNIYGSHTSIFMVSNVEPSGFSME